MLFAVLTILSFVFLMLYVIFAILESTRQKMILFGTLATILFLVLTMMQGKAQSVPKAKT